MKMIDCQSKTYYEPDSLEVIYQKKIQIIVDDANRYALVSPNYSVIEYRYFYKMIKDLYAEYAIKVLKKFKLPLDSFSYKDNYDFDRLVLELNIFVILNTGKSELSSDLVASYKSVRDYDVDSLEYQYAEMINRYIEFCGNKKMYSMDLRYIEEFINKSYMAYAKSKLDGLNIHPDLDIFVPFDVFVIKLDNIINEYWYKKDIMVKLENIAMSYYVESGVVYDGKINKLMHDAFNNIIGNRDLEEFYLNRFKRDIRLDNTLERRK